MTYIAISCPTENVHNNLLQSAPAAELNGLLPRLRPLKLINRATVLTPDAPIENVLFVESGIVSMIARLEDGSLVEVGLIGREGFVGLPVLLGVQCSALDAIVQVEGTALRMPAPEFRSALAEMPVLKSILLRYVDAFQLQVSQTAACNTRHQIEQRLARWLLMTQDRAEGESFTMTQEFMSNMLGVRRPGVTLALGVLQRAGLVRHERSSMQVIDRPGLEAASCECYAIVRRRFDRLLPPGRTAAPTQRTTFATERTL